VEKRPVHLGLRHQPILGGKKGKEGGIGGVKTPSHNDLFVDFSFFVSSLCSFCMCASIFEKSTQEPTSLLVYRCQCTGTAGQQATVQCTAKLLV
jgi:hypothetical protein